MKWALEEKRITRDLWVWFRCLKKVWCECRGSWSDANTEPVRISERMGTCPPWARTQWIFRLDQRRTENGRWGTGLVVMVVVIAKRETLADGVLKLLPQRPVGQGFPARRVRFRFSRDRAAALSLSTSPGTRSRAYGLVVRSFPLFPSGRYLMAWPMGAFFNTADVTISAPAPQVLGTCIRVFGLPLWHCCRPLLEKCCTELKNKSRLVKKNMKNTIALMLLVQGIQYNKMNEYSIYFCTDYS